MKYEYRLDEMGFFFWVKFTIVKQFLKMCSTFMKMYHAKTKTKRIDFLPLWKISIVSSSLLWDIETEEELFVNNTIVFLSFSSFKFNTFFYARLLKVKVKIYKVIWRCYIVKFKSKMKIYIKSWSFIHLTSSFHSFIKYICLHRDFKWWWWDCF